MTTMSSLAGWLLLCGLAVLGPAPARASLYDPHVPTMYDPAFRTWFEGWYVRITTAQPGGDGGDDATGTPLPSSLGLIVGTMPRGRLGWNISLASLLVQQGDAALQTLESTGVQLSVTGAGGQTVVRDPEPHTPPDFSVVADDGTVLLHMRGEQCALHVALGGLTMDARCTGPPVRWGPDDESPEGGISGLPTQLVGLHWYVYSLGTPVAWSLRNDSSGETVTGAGLAHFEKNWGGTFPPGWAWAQGVDLAPGVSPTRPRAALTLAGGQLPTPVLPGRLVPDAWLLGVRSPGGREWDFRPQDPTSFAAEAEPCNATLRLTAHSPWTGRSAVVTARAGGRLFGHVTCPLAEGFEPGTAVEAYRAAITVELYEGTPGWWRGDQELVEVVEIAGAALEFGGDRMCSAGEAGASGAAVRAGEGGEEAATSWRTATL